MPIWQTVRHARVGSVRSSLAGLQRSYTGNAHDKGFPYDDSTVPERRRNTGPRGVRQQEGRKNDSKGKIRTKQTDDVSTYTRRLDRLHPRQRDSYNTASRSEKNTPPPSDDNVFDADDEEVTSVAEALLGDSVDWSREPRKEAAKAPAAAPAPMPQVEEPRIGSTSSLDLLKEQNAVLLERIALLERLAALEKQTLGLAGGRAEPVATASARATQVMLGSGERSGPVAGIREISSKPKTNGTGRSNLELDDMDDETHRQELGSAAVAEQRDTVPSARDEQGGRQRMLRFDRKTSRDVSSNTAAFRDGIPTDTREYQPSASPDELASEDGLTEDAPTEDVATNDTSNIDGASSAVIEADETEPYPDGFYHKRGQGLRDLPLPPMLRPAPKLKDRFKNLDFKGVFRPPRPGGPTMADNLRNAPFSTAFAMNPYARALATGNRECCFTGIKLPLSCFLEFHLADSPDGKGVSLLPLSLVASLVPKNKSERSRTPEERKVVEQVEAERGDPHGVASYITAQRAAVQFISESKNRARDYAITKRLKHSMGSDQALRSITWREDMDDVILNNLRQIVLRRLRYHFNAKEVSDNPGLLASPPGDGPDLNRLQEMDNVMCILCLKIPETIQADVQGESMEDESQGGVQSNRPKGRTIGFLSDQELNRLLAAESKVFLQGVQVLPPPEVPSKTYYPTFRYRNRRVAVYSLPDLLGADRLAELVKDTAFRNSSFVAMAQALGAVDLQMWLLKLQSYLGKTKAETMKI